MDAVLDMAEGGSLLCKQCDERIASHTELMLCGSTPFHSACYNARRQLDRAMNSAPDKEQLKTWKKIHPLEYRNKTLELRMAGAQAESAPGSRKRRGEEQRNLAAQILNEIRSFTKVSVERKVFMLPERAFQAYFIREEGFSAQEAKARWEADKADRSVYRMEEGGVLKLAVRGHTTFVHEDGQEMSSSRQAIGPDDGHRPEVDLSAALNHDDFRPCPASEVFAATSRPVALARSRSRRAHRAASSRSAHDAVADDDDNDEDEARMHAPSRRSPRPRTASGSGCEHSPRRASRSRSAGTARSVIVATSRSNAASGSRSEAADALERPGEPVAASRPNTASTFELEAPQRLADVVRDKKLVSDVLEAAIGELEVLNKKLGNLVASMNGNELLEEFDITPTLASSRQLALDARTDLKSARSTKAVGLRHSDVGMPRPSKLESEAFET